MPHPDEGDEVGICEECRTNYLGVFVPCPAHTVPGVRNPYDSREAVRQANLAEARRVVLGTPCHDIPSESGEVRDVRP